MRCISRISFGLLLPLLLLSSCCGYRFGDGGYASRYQTISVPFVQGDWDGDFTVALVDEIARSGAFQYERDGGAVILLVKILDICDENIGFRYYRNKEGELKKDIIPTETRITAQAEVSLVEAASGSTLLGPARLSASVEFDHDFYASRHASNIFSLGQLVDYDAAYDAVYRPLNRALAHKIVDFVNDSW